VSFQNKNVLILGCSSGIGRATAEMFGKEQANLYLLASEKAKYTTGRVFDMDAGALL
jgi:NAD(P)-dependent dehydrogenase (short-subunit alcohol dehydrogenase family)